MTSLNGRHAEKAIDMPKPSAPRVHVQRSVSRDTIAIHFSASGEEEEEEEEEFREYFEEGLDDQSIVTGLEAKEDLYFEPRGGHDPTGPASQPILADGLSESPAVLPVSENTVKLLEAPLPAVQVLSTVPLALSPGSSSSGPLASSPSVSSLSEQKTSSSSPLSSPSKSPVLSSSASSSTLSSSKPFMSLVKSLSTEVEPKEPPPPPRHRHLMKTLVKSLSTDTSKQESDTVSYKPPDSKLNLHLFKQFTQPRNTGGDSKTAPSSPLTSPSDTRSFFKVPEMEAKIEDTKRRLSEVIHEPFQLLSKIIGEESGSHRPKALSSSASELSNLSSLNGHLESNHNYSIKEEECDSEGDGEGSNPSIPRSDHPKSIDEPPKEVELKSSQVSSLKDLGLKTSSLVLEKCSLSALVSKEDEEFCELYSEEFDLEMDGEGKVDKLLDTPLKPEELADDVPTLDSDEEVDLAMQHPELPVKTLGFFILCVYAYLILPLPHYVSGLFLGIGLGFMTAVCMIWFFTPPSAHKYHRLHKNQQHWNTGTLDIKEPEILKLPEAPPSEEEEQEAWVNALLGRMFWDFLGEKYWSELVSKKIQMKLSKIKLPYFMNELTLTELDMGVAVPKILQAFKPYVDHQGLWIDLEMSYNGSFLMTLETKMNLTKLGKEPLVEALKVGEIGKEGCRPRAYCLADSDEESSSAGSSEEDDAPEPSVGDKPLLPGAEGYVGGHRTSKIMRFVDKITKSKYFQKATETEFIKKKIEEVSNTPLLLTVEVQECRGTLAVNIPPPPSDRIWYGFRKPPYVELKARPKLGEREVTLVHVTDWIEKKLEQEFQKVFVMPNMDDVYIPIMHSAMDPRSTSCLLKDTLVEAADQL
uniref:Testis expressed 2 n=1 Tax=Myotis myotis TaxID=51298 RepID=A0A7J7T8Y6_MYOMY|nr:testis expressed 2 [Myotis myotis]